MLKEKTISAIKEIIKANDNRKLTLFIGSGMSDCVENGKSRNPSWNELINKLKAELNISENENENDFLKIAQLFYLKYMEEKNIKGYYKKIEESINYDIEPSEIHKLLFQVNPNTIITTNWDIVLEKTAVETGYIYDVIKKDEDLVNSHLSQKIIKMHGDLKAKNIVFKEDDYINYRNNFPLIENYIKSILSTNTVLFLGYSYNDINLKQITKWLQNKSRHRPKMFLLMFEKNEAQEIYLKNHGIEVILLDENIETNIKYNDKSNRTLYFLNEIKNRNTDHIILSEEEDVVDFYYKKFEPLFHFNSLHFTHILNIFENAHLLYLPSCEAVIELHTLDFRGNISKKYNAFIELIKNDDEHPKINSILETMCRAKIIGIKNSFMQNEFINFKREQKLSVNTPSKLAFKSFRDDNFKRALEYVQKQLKVSSKKRDFINLFIAKFNINNILILDKNLHYPSFTEGKRLEATKESIETQYNNLPDSYKELMKPIMEIANFTFFYKQFYSTIMRLESKEESYNIISNGGFSMTNEEHRERYELNVLYDFVKFNGLMIENFNEYRNIVKRYMDIWFLKQFNNEFIYLNLNEIEILIRLFSKKDIINLIKFNNGKNKFKKTKIKVEEGTISFILENIIDHFINLINESKNLNNDNKLVKLSNSFTILGFIDCRNFNDEIYSRINTCIENSNIHPFILDSFNNFLNLQYNLYDIKISKSILNKSLDLLIKKILHNETTFREFREIQNCSFSSYYNYFMRKKIKYNNSYLIELLIEKLNSFDEKRKFELERFFILNIYSISSLNIKKIFNSKLFHSRNNYILNNTNKFEVINYLIWLKISDINIYDNDIKNLCTTYLKQFDEEGFTFELYRLKDSLEILNKKLKDKDFSEFIDKIIILSKRDNPLSNI